MIRSRLISMVSTAWPLATVLLALAGCGGGDGLAPREAPQASAVQAPPSASQVLNYAELAYEPLFPGHAIDRSFGPYIYREYPGTGNFIGVAGDTVYALGNVVNNFSTPVAVARLSDFNPETHADLFGTRIDQKITVAGLEREFVVWVPWKARDKTQLPVVFMFHGTGGDGDKFLRISGWREKANAEGFIAVFPSALWHCFYQDEDFDGVPERHVVTKWAAGKLGTEVRPLCTASQLAELNAAQRQRVDHALPDEQQFFRDMVAWLRANHPVDARRIFVSGFSNGCENAGYLGATASELIAALHCGSSVVSVDTVARAPMPTIHSMGELEPDQSRQLGYANGVIPMTQSLVDNPRFKNGVIQPWLHMLAVRDSLNWSPGTVNGVLTSQFAYTTPLVAGRQNLRSIVIQGQTHQYPNGKNHPLVLADLLWDFFKANPLP